MNSNVETLLSDVRKAELSPAEQADLVQALLGDMRDGAPEGEEHTLPAVIAKITRGAALDPTEQSTLIHTLLCDKRDRAPEDELRFLQSAIAMVDALVVYREVPKTVA